MGCTSAAAGASPCSLARTLTTPTPTLTALTLTLTLTLTPIALALARWECVASTVVECTVVETQRPSCRKQTDAAAAPGSPDWGALLSADVPEAKGRDHEMLAAPDQEAEGASGLARVPMMAGVKRRRKQSAGWAVGALQRRCDSVKSAPRSQSTAEHTARACGHTHTAPEAHPRAKGCPSGPERESPRHLAALELSRPAWCARPKLERARCPDHAGRASRTSGTSCPTSASSRTRLPPSSSAWAAWAAGRYT